MTRILVDSGLIADGSVKGFLSGTHFNRCKKLHPIAALGLKILHFKSFLTSYDEKLHAERLDLSEIFEILINDSSKIETRNNTLFELTDILKHYDSYVKQTMDGKHGQTAKFVFSYISLVELFQLFERAIRTCDLKLYIYTANQICSLFFSMNHQNYARWLAKNVDDLINIESTHSGLSEEFANGALSIRRTAKHFCRSAIDLTLEQTINCDAANKCTGITAFTNSIDARRRWSETHSIRTAIISNLLQFLGLEKSSDSESRYQTKMFKVQLMKFSQEMEENINPFSDINPNKLFNLSSGKAASETTANFLLNVQSDGMQQMEQFISECHLDKDRFHRAIRRNVVHNFSAEIDKNKNPSKRTDENKIEQNFLVQVLCLALKKQIDVSLLLSFPLTRVPHSLAHSDGIMNSRNQRGELTELFTSRIEGQHNECPVNFEVDIIDGFYFLSTLRESPTKYGAFAIFVLERLCETTAYEIHVIFDKYEKPSPRDPDTKKCNELYDSHSVNFKIQGKNQERNASLTKCLTNNGFREELVKFLVQFWSEDDAIGPILNDKRVLLSFGSKCYVFSNEYVKGIQSSTFENNHFEVESKMILHMNRMVATKIRIRTSNPDTILVYLLHHMQFWSHNKDIWIEAGDLKKNTVQRINVRQIFNLFSPVFVKALPAWYIFTGSRYECSFYGKGKKTCLKILEKNTAAQVAFGQINSNISFYNEDNIKEIEKFTCNLYNSKSEKVDDVRVKMFDNRCEMLIKKGICLHIKLIFTPFPLMKVQYFVFRCRLKIHAAMQECTP